ncbi:MAG: hypothetical protein HQL17_08680, partial [Candidatus Omnitrophica bacterium]|nr:hypothetical protein [Candidatus Omnitrophota bacterium]
AIHARLKDDGQLLFTTPSTRSFLAGISGPKWVSYIVPHHILLYEPTGLTRLLKASGFARVRILTDFQWVSLSFLNERVANLVGAFKGLTRHFKAMEDKGKGILVPVTNGQMLVIAGKN